jgi:hypothetical protein
MSISVEDLKKAIIARDVLIRELDGDVGKLAYALRLARLYVVGANSKALRYENIVADDTRIVDEALGLTKESPASHHVASPPQHVGCDYKMVEPAPDHIRDVTKMVEPKDEGGAVAAKPRVASD